MNFINNMKIGLRLGLGFAITLTLMLVLGVISYQRLGELHQEIKDSTDVAFPKTVQANNVIDAVNNMRAICAMVSFTAAPSSRSRSTA